MEKNKKIKIYRTVMLIIVVALTTFIVTTILTYDGSIRYIVTGKNPQMTNSAKKLDALLATLTELVEEKYIGDVNEEELIDGAARGLVESIGDVYTAYYSKEELEEFTEETLGSFVGIGVYMQANKEKDAVEVVSPIKGSPAENAGLKSGDLIIKADGEEYKAADLEKLSNHIKGKEGTEVSLTIKRNEEEFEIKVKRGNVHINYVASEMLEENIAHIAIATFDEDCAKDFEEEYNKVVSEGAKALILDLRSNGGGVVDEALAIADMFCEKEQTTLIQVDKDGNEKITKSKNEQTIKMPVIVLTNEGTASASEILVAALKDNKKAEIIGQKTYGKGVIQELIYLSNGGALKVTSAEYYTPNKEKINEVGIEPDIKIMYDITNPEVDEQLNKAIEVIKEKIK